MDDRWLYHWISLTWISCGARSDLQLVHINFRFYTPSSYSHIESPVWKMYNWYWFPWLVWDHVPNVYIFSHWDSIWALCVVSFLHAGKGDRECFWPPVLVRLLVHLWLQIEVPRENYPAYIEIGLILRTTKKLWHSLGNQFRTPWLFILSL